MKKRIKLKRLGRKTSHRKALVRNLVQSLVMSGNVETTIAKAKVLKQEFDRFVSYFHRTNINDETKLRYCKGFLTRKEAVEHFYKVILPLSIGRTGGYTSIARTRDRHGDGATMALIVLTKNIVSERNNSTKNKHETVKTTVLEKDNSDKGE